MQQPVLAREAGSGRGRALLVPAIYMVVDHHSEPIRKGLDAVLRMLY